MRVVVAAVSQDCAAARALRVEGVPFELQLLDRAGAYAELLEQCWDAGAFVLVEHDIVPWPGAIAALAECEEPWCVHEYPLAPRKLRWSLGLAKFGAELVHGSPQLPDWWRDRDWNQLDGAVVPAVLSTGLREPHVHAPPVAHAKAGQP